MKYTPEQIAAMPKWERDQYVRKACEGLDLAAERLARNDVRNAERKQEIRLDWRRKMSIMQRDRSFS